MRSGKSISFSRVLLASAVVSLLIVAGLPAGAARQMCLGQRATIVGTNGNERLVGTNGNDVIAAREGSDYVIGRGGDDLICGGLGSDHLEAGPGHDRMTGDGGSDSLVGGHATELLTGEAGDDTFFPSGGVGGRIKGGGGRDWVAFTDRECPGGIRVDLTDHRIRYPGCERGWSKGVWTVRSVDRVDGSRGPDVLIGSGRANQLLGQDGADKILGKAGNDLLNGGTGGDRGRGGTGSDRCISLEVRDSC